MLYISIITYTVLSGLFLSACQRKVFVQLSNRKLGLKLGAISLPLLIILVTNDSCTDFYAYVRIFNRASFDTLATTDQEIGWMLLNSIVKNVITTDGVVGINFIRGLTFVLFIYAIAKMHEFIDIGWGWIAFVCMCYFNIFSMVAFMIAVAFVLLAFENVLMKKHARMIIELILAISMHYTAVIPSFALILYFLCYGRKYTRKGFVLLSLCGALVIGVLARSLFSYAVAVLPFLTKYAKYGTYVAGGTGLRQLVNYLPIFWCLYHTAWKSQNRTMNLSFISALVGFTVGMCSYSINNLLRTYLYFSFLYIVYLSALIRNNEQNMYVSEEKSNAKEIKKNNGHIPFTPNSFKFLVLLYLIYRVYYLLASEWATGISSGFGNFHFLF